MYVSDFEMTHWSFLPVLEQVDLRDCGWSGRVSLVVGQELRHKGSGLHWHSWAPSYQGCLGEYVNSKKEWLSEEP